MATFTRLYILLRRSAKILSRVALILLLLLITIWIVIQFSPVQTWLVKKISNRLSADLQTEVKVGRVDFGLFHTFLLEDVLIKDRQKDTLAYIGEVFAKTNNWFFLKDEIIVEEIRLNRTNLSMRRVDSTWNYQFLVDYFQQPASSKKQKPVQFRLKKVSIEQFSWTQTDQWSGTDMKASVAQLQLNIQAFDAIGKTATIDELILHQPVFRIRDYAGKKPTTVPLSDSAFHQRYDSVFTIPSGWSLKANQLLIDGGVFENEVETNRAPYSYFDEAHFRFQDINGRITQLRLKGDTLNAGIDLSANEKSGFDIRKLKSDLTWHSKGMIFNNLTIETPYSKVGDFFAMRFRHFQHDMNHFLDHVKLEGHFKKSTIHTKDIAYFAPALKQWNFPILLTGEAEGSLERLEAKNIQLETGKQTRFNGDFQIDKIYDVDEMRLNVNSTIFKTSFTDACLFHPPLSTYPYPVLKALNEVAWKGNLTGRLRDFSTKGIFETSLGTIDTDFRMSIPSWKTPTYAGTFNTKNLQLGFILGEKWMGNVNAKATLNGEGFTASTLKTEWNSQISLLEIKEYPYSHIQFSGKYVRKLFEGDLKIEDPNAQAIIHARIDASKPQIGYNIAGNIIGLNLKKTKLLENDITLKGSLSSDFHMNKLEDFDGFIKLEEATILAANKKPLLLNICELNQKQVGEKNKLLEIKTDPFEANIVGDYSLSGLPPLFRSLLSNYFPTYITAPKEKPSPQTFDFDIFTRNMSPYLSLFTNSFKGFDESSLSGTIHTDEQFFRSNIHIPSFSYEQIDFEKIDIETKSNLQQISIDGNIDRVVLSNNLYLPNTVFKAYAANDTGLISLQTRATETLNDASLQTKFQATANGFLFKFLPSTLVVNDKTWTIEREGDLQIEKTNIFSDGIRLTSGREELFAYTHPSETGNYNDIAIEIKKVEVGELLPILFTNPRLEGVFSGKVDVLNPFGKYMIEAKLRAEAFRFNNDSIGVLPIEGNYNSTTRIANYFIESVNDKHYFTIRGKTDLSDPEHPQTDNTLEINQAPLRLLEPYLTGILTQIQGIGTGMLKIKGEATEPDLIGEIRLNNSSFVIDYTRCRYRIKEGSVVKFQEKKLILPNIQIRDTLGRRAVFNGELRHQFFNDMFFNFTFRTDETDKGLLVLNTTKKDNSLFFGNVIAKANGSITGPMNNLLIKLKGEPTDSSKFYLSTSDTRVTGTANFIVFKKYGIEQSKKLQLESEGNVTVDLDLTVNPFAKAYIILDENTNDVIEGQGRGALNLRVGTNEKTTMTGNFEITGGRYNFNWQSLFKRPFLINKGSINWNGDPYDARINIDAFYKVEKAMLPSNLTSGCSSERADMDVVANLSNTLKNPEIKFRFELPTGHPCRNNPVTQNGLLQLYNNPDELNRQVISLLLIGSFANNSSTPGASNMGLGSTFFTNAAGTISEFVAQQVTSGLYAMLRTIPALKDFKLDPYVTFTPGLISGTQAQGLGFQGTGSFGFTSRLLKGRMLIKAGGSLLVAAGQASTVQNNNQLTPDLSIEWLVSPDGKLRLIGFYRTVFDIQRRNDRTGISFSYVKEFDRLW